MSDLSAGQKKYLLQHKKHKRIVCVSRILILLSFLFIWEFTANVGIIDSFIFSSPSKIALCFWGMVLDKSIFLHIGVTLYETIVSFLLVIAISILVAVTLWFSSKLLRDPGSLSGSPEQPAQIGAGATLNRLAGGYQDYHYRGRNVCGDLRQHPKPLYQFYHRRPRKDKVNLYLRRKQVPCPDQGRSPQHDSYHYQ